MMLRVGRWSVVCTGVVCGLRRGRNTDPGATQSNSPRTNTACSVSKLLNPSTKASHTTMKLLLLIINISTVLYSAQANDVLQLTLDNYDEVTESKSVFIRFFAPWCAHSKKMVRSLLRRVISRVSKSITLAASRSHNSFINSHIKNSFSRIGT